MADNKHIGSVDNTKPYHADELLALISACIAGNRQAQKKFYDTYAPVVYGVIRRYLYNQNTADEVLNDVFYNVFTKLQQYSFKGPIEGWMRRIAINLITDHLRKHAKFENEKPTDKEYEHIAMPEGQLSRLGYKELLALIHTLPDTQRTVFNLYVFEDIPHKEIATLLQLNENNCRWYLNDARRRLKEKINNLM